MLLLPVKACPVEEKMRMNPAADHSSGGSPGRKVELNELKDVVLYS